MVERETLCRGQHIISGYVLLTPNSQNGRLFCLIISVKERSAVYLISISFPSRRQKDRLTHRRVKLGYSPLVLPGPADAGLRPAAARGRHLAGAVALAPRGGLPVAEVGDAAAVQLQERVIG